MEVEATAAWVRGMTAGLPGRWGPGRQKKTYCQGVANNAARPPGICSAAGVPKP